MHSHHRFQTTLRTTLIVAIFATLMLATPARATTYEILHSFAPSFTGGYEPEAGVISDAEGNLYGTTNLGGAGGYGSVFELEKSSDGKWSYHVLHNFGPCLDGGGGPAARLVFDEAGNLYGTTPGGGTSKACGSGGCGVVFRLTPHANGFWTEQVLYSFTGGEDGASPRAGLTLDAAGNLYGTTPLGGVTSNSCPSGCGVVFKLTPNSDGSLSDSTLYRFTGGADGGNSYSTLVLDPEGSLYGTTAIGGVVSKSCPEGCGVVFKLGPNSDESWTESVLHNFGSGTDGVYPHVGVAFDSEGNLYGTTEGGGGAAANLCPAVNGCGVVFKLIFDSDGSWTENVLYRFTGGKDGSTPNEVIVDQAGNLYGTTMRGGFLSNVCSNVGCGVVFELSDGCFKVLHTFWGYATVPMAGVIRDESGNLYGTTSGTPSYGTVFEITP